MELEKLKLMVTIVDRPRGEEVARLCRDQGLFFHLGLLGRGTASSEMLDLLGLGETDKAVLLSLVPEPAVAEIRALLTQRLRLRYPGQGILFTLPLSAVNARAARNLSIPHIPQEGDETSMEDHISCTHDLILVSAQQGRTDEVMDAARAAGAGGGTLLHIRRAGSKDAEQFFGIALQKEMELVAILAPRKDRTAIMTAIARALKLEGRDGGVVFSLPVESIEGLE
jgi:hypothetical protein